MITSNHSNIDNNAIQHKHNASLELIDHALDYTIIIGNDIFYQNNFVDLCNLSNIQFESYDNIVIITDDNINNLYATELYINIQKLNNQINVLIIKAGENSKTASTKESLELQMLEKQCGKNTLLIALGGGVVGDITGFIAATYMRGIDYIHIPTSLLAMVDSSVGGKNAINTIYGKNQIGTFYNPKSVIINLAYFKTLKIIQITEGIVEAIKLFILQEPDTFNIIKNYILSIDNIEELYNIHQNTLLYTIITKAIKLKANIVANDYKENNLRMILNFGHTIAHALELITDYKLSHGDAVAFGIILEILIANKMQIFSDADLLNDIITMFNKLGIAARIKQTMYLILNINIQQGFSDDNNNLIEQLIKIMQYDKKNRQHKITMILKNNNSYIISRDIDINIIKQVLIDYNKNVLFYN